MKKIQGFLYDVARGMRGDVRYVEELMTRLAGYGYNLLVLHLEYRFQFPSHPLIGPPDSLGPAEIAVLQAKAVELGMELVPCVNCAGHCEGIGLLEKYKHLAVDPSGALQPVARQFNAGRAGVSSLIKTEGAVEQLQVGSPGALALVKELYADLFACFPSRYFHIGGDEVRHLAAQMPEAAPEERVRVMQEHLLTIIDYVRARGKVPMMWADMLLEHPELLARIPGDVILCDWEYYDVPQRSGPGSLDSQVLCKEAGRRVLACPAVNGFYGSPVVSANSTENIRVFTAENRSIGGDGILLCTWETNFGNFFSSHWPWIYLAGECAKGQGGSGMDFLRAYTAREWGLDTDDLAQWHAAADAGIQHILADAADRPFLLLRNLRHEVFRTRNILEAMDDARSWFHASVRARMKDTLREAEAVALRMVDGARRRKEEPRRLLEWTRVLLCLVGIGDRVEELALAYHEGAVRQGTDPRAFAQSMDRCRALLMEMHRSMDTLAEWTRTLVEQENHCAEEAAWVPEAQRHLEAKAAELDAVEKSGAGLVSFEQFVRRAPGVPNRVLTR